MSKIIPVITCPYRAHRIIRNAWLSTNYRIEHGLYVIEVDGVEWGYTLAEINNIIEVLDGL